MGLFKSLLKKVVDEVVENVVESNDNSKSSSVSNVTSAGEEPSITEEVLRERLEKIMAKEWSEYEIRKEVPASTMNAPEKSRAYSYGMYLNGEPKAFIMVLTVKHHYALKEVVNSQDASIRKGVPYMNFLTHLPNRESYISNRLKENIK